MPTTVASFQHLSGLRVLDMSQFEAGPSCTEVLAWLGADVVKVENPEGGDPGRRSYRDPNVDDSWYFLLLNANKRSISIDVKSDEGRNTLLELASKADVFIENFGPGVIDRLGLGYERLSAINPRLIYAQVKGFGEGSPLGELLAFDMIAQATGGLMSITGEPDGRPVKLGTTLGDTGTGMLLAISILASVILRSKTGKGERLQVAMQDAMLHYMRVGLSAQRINGSAAPRNGAKLVYGINPPSGLFPCRPFGPNDYVCVYTSHANPDHWRRILQVIGRSDLLGDQRFDTHGARVEHEAEVDGLVANWTKERDKFEAERLLGAAGIPAGAVRDTQDLQDDENFERRGIMQIMRHSRNGEFKMPGWPVVHDGQVPALSAAPILGQHERDVLRDWLGKASGKAPATDPDGASAELSQID